jgi:hypothetical protein
MACLEPVPNSLLRQPSFRTVMGKQGRLSCDNIREFLLQGRGDPGVDLLSPTLQQCTVCGILNQAVLERVLGVRGYSSPEYQFGDYELIQCVI